MKFYSKKLAKSDLAGAGGKAQWSRALTAPAEKPGLVPSINTDANNHL